MADQNQVVYMKQIVYCLLWIPMIMGLVSAYALAKDDETLVRRIKVQGDHWHDEYQTNPRDLEKPQRLEEIKANITSAISRQIISHVRGVVYSSESELDGKSLSHTSRETYISSNLKLRDLQFITYRKSNKSVAIFGYLSKSEFAKQEAEEIAGINGIVDIGREMESKGEEGYLFPYYKAYLRTFNITKPILGSNNEQDLQFWLENKLRSILSGTPIKTEITDTGSEAKQIDIYLQTKAHGTGFLADLPILQYKGLKQVGGKFTCFYDERPHQNIEEQKLILSINPALVENDHDIYDHAIGRAVSVERSINLDFTSVFKINFTCQSEDLSVSIEPQYGSVAVKTVLWEMGDGTERDNINGFVHTYNRAGTYQIKMTVNSSFTAQKEIEATEPPKAMAAIQHSTIPEPQAPPANTSIVLLQTSETPEPEEYIQLPEPAILGHTSIGMELASFANWNQLKAHLDQRKQDNILTYGGLTRKVELSENWIVVFDPQTQEVLAVLEPLGTGFYELKSKQEIKDVFSTYRGRSAIYISYY